VELTERHNSENENEITPASHCTRWDTALSRMKMSKILLWLEWVDETIHRVREGHVHPACPEEKTERGSPCWLSLRAISQGQNDIGGFDAFGRSVILVPRSLDITVAVCAPATIEVNARSKQMYTTTSALIVPSRLPETPTSFPYICICSQLYPNTSGKPVRNSFYYVASDRLSSIFF
jgi:hypothetical protein